MAVASYVQPVLKAVLDALGGEDYAYYEFEIKEGSERSKNKVALKVLVPRAVRSRAIGQITNALNNAKPKKYVVTTARDGAQLNVAIPDIPQGSKPDAQFIRLDIKPVGVGRGTAATAINESAQCLYADLAFNVLKRKLKLDEIFEEDDLKAAYHKDRIDVDFEDIMGLDNQWRQSSILGANKLYESFHSAGKSYRFYRGGGLDDDQIKKAFHKIKKKTKFTSEDKWNPADIWMAVSDFNPNTITDNADTGLVKNLNAFLIEQYDKRNLMGISLKKITGSADLKEINYTKDKSGISASDHGAIVTYKTGNRAPSKDISIKYGSGTNDVIVFRTFGGDKTANWNGEVGGAAAAQGKISGPLAIEIVNTFGSYKFPTNQELWREAGDVKKVGALAEKIYTLLKKFNASGLPSKKADAIADIAAQPRGFLYSKYYGLLMADAIKSISSKEKRNECVKDIYLYASSQWVDSGFHLKLT